jgi:hypothetical protein
MVRDYLNAELQREADTVEETRTELGRSGEAPATAWNGPSGERLHAVLLCHTIEAGCAVTGLAVLRPAGPFRHPGPLATELSRASGGDRTEMVVLG